MKDITLKALTAEFLGTFLLVSFVIGALNTSTFLAPAVMAALIVGLLVYLVGDLSGAQFNPAVTVGLWSVGKVSLVPAVLLIMVQMFGAVAAYVFFGQFIFELGSLMELPTPDDSVRIVVAEALGTAILCFGIASVAFKKTKPALSGVVIGVSLFLGASLASLLSNGIINPAVAFGLSSVSPSYVFGPLLGGIFGFNLYKWMLSIKK